MTDEQKATSVAAIDAAVRHFHTQAHLAARIGKSTSHVSRLVAGEVVIDAVDAVSIDKASAGKIARHRLRPDLWDAPKRASRSAEPGEKLFSVVDHVLRDGDRFAETPAKMLTTKERGDELIAMKIMIDRDSPRGVIVHSDTLTIERVADRRAGVRDVPALAEKARARRAGGAGADADRQSSRERKADGETRAGKRQGKGQKEKGDAGGRAATQGRQRQKAEGKGGRRRKGR